MCSTQDFSLYEVGAPILEKDANHDQTILTKG